MLTPLLHVLRLLKRHQLLTPQILEHAVTEFIIIVCIFLNNLLSRCITAIQVLFPCLHDIFEMFYDSIAELVWNDLLSV